MELPDPSMPTQPSESRNYFLACYAVSLIQGQTILGSPIRHQTVVNYLKAAYILLRDRDLSFESEKDYIEIILSALANYECVPNRRNMITDGMVQWFIDESRTQGPDSALASITDWIILGRYTGARASEWCQTTQSNYAVISEWPGSPSLAFTRDDFTFLGQRERRLTDKDLLHLTITHIYHVRMEWRKQKNKDNGQKIDFARDDSHPDYCAVRAALRIYLRSIRLGRGPREPLGVFQNPKGQAKFITATMTASHLRTSASLVLNIKKEDPSLKLWSTHSIRVTAANLLHRANLSDSYIQTRLRWKSSSFLMYLRNTIYGADAHTKAININLGKKEQPKASYRTIPEEHEPILLSMSTQ
jgi:hypothetical protein